MAGKAKQATPTKSTRNRKPSARKQDDGVYSVYCYPSIANTFSADQKAEAAQKKVDQAARANKRAAKKTVKHGVAELKEKEKENHRKFEHPILFTYLITLIEPVVIHGTLKTKTQEKVC
jgi:hypothetical protein